MNALLLALLVAPAYPPADVDLSADLRTLAKFDGCQVRATFEVAASPRPVCQGVAWVNPKMKRGDGDLRLVLIPDTENPLPATVTVVGKLAIVPHPATRTGPAYSVIRLIGSIEGRSRTP